MPIEDIDFLKQNSIKQTYIFLVNSADRDRYAYPTPSEYVVDFTAPFNNVVGLQVLHASIPRTMYNIDARNNKVRFMIHVSGMSDDEVSTAEYHDAYVPVGDYTIQSLLVELNKILTTTVFGTGNQFSEPKIPPDQASITVETTTNPPDIQSLLRFRCPYPFCFDMKGSTIAEALGFDLFVDSNEANAPLLERRFQPPLATLPNPKLYHSVDAPPSVALGAESIVFDGPRGVVRKVALGDATRVAQQFTITTPAYLTKIFAALTTNDGAIRADSVVTYEIYSDASGKPGTAIPILNTVNGTPITGRIPVSFVDGGLSDQADPIATFLMPGTYWLVMSQTSSASPVEAYFNDVPSNLRKGTFSIWRGNDWESQDTPEGIHFELCVRLIAQDEYHVLTAPGIFSLIGERYVVLRCREIEENSFRSLAYGKYCLGLAKFQLGIIGYSESRLDFSSIPLREFHPIGKLSRLTFRFETASGELYDFKGINHDITIAVHYYEPVQKQKFEASILNPNYSGNVLQYYSQRDALLHGTYNSDHDEEEDADDDSENDFADYREQEARHLPENVRRLDLEALHHFREEDLEETDED